MQRNRRWNDIIIAHVGRFLAGDNAAFAGELYCALFAVGKAYLRGRMHCNHTQEDIILTAMRKLWKSLQEGGTFHGPAENAPAFYRRIVHNTWLDHLHSIGKVRIHVESEVWERDPDPDGLSADGLDGLPLTHGEDAVSPADLAMGKEKARRIRKCVRKLPPDLCAIVTLWSDGGISGHGLAKMLRTSLSTVRRRLAKAFALLEICLRNAGIDLG